MEANELRQLLQETEGRLRKHIDGRIEKSEQGLREYIDGREIRLREYIDGRIQKSEQGLREYIREYVDGRIEKAEQRIREYVYDAETRIVRAFGAYQQAASVRFRKIESDLSNVNASTTEQMDAFSAKLLELETRIVALERPAPPAA